jgi:ATP-dependent protease ClpP protease subunit
MANRKLDSDDFMLDTGLSRGFRKSGSAIYEFYLSGTITGPEDYIEWFNTIRSAGPQDEVKIYINSSGGDLNCALQFMRVLSETQATVICSVEGSCMSAATMIFLCADVFEVTPHSLFMFHNYSGGIFGKGGEIYDQAVFEREWSKQFLQHIYKNFLTSKEIDSLLENKDLWLHSEEVSNRVEKLCEARTKEQEDARNALSGDLQDESNNE